MIEATRYPIDYDALQRGDCIPAEAIEQSLSMKRTDGEYPWKLLAIKDEAKRHMEARGEVGVVITTCDHGLQVLTHEQAAHYLKRRFYKGQRDMAWSLGTALQVDRSMLTDDTRKAHDDFVVKASWKLQQMRKRQPQIGNA